MVAAWNPVLAPCEGRNTRFVRNQENNYGNVRFAQVVPAHHPWKLPSVVFQPVTGNRHAFDRVQPFAAGRAQRCAVRQSGAM